MSYEELIKNDLQLQYARNAVRYYKSNTVPEFLEKDPHKKSVIQRLSDTVNSQASSVNVSRNSTPAPSLAVPQPILLATDLVAMLEDISSV